MFKLILIIFYEVNTQVKIDDYFGDFQREFEVIIVQERFLVIFN